MATTLISDILGRLKRIYDGDNLVNTTYPASKAWGMIPKAENHVGEGTFKTPILYADNASASGTFAGAQANTSNPQTERFFLTRVSSYGTWKVGAEALEASRSQVGAYMKEKRLQIDSVFRSVTRRLGQMIYSDGYGALAQVSASGAADGSPTTLKDRSQTVFFEKGQKWYQTAADAAKNTEVTDDTLTVSSVDRSGNAVTFTGAATNDNAWLFPAGYEYYTNGAAAGSFKATFGFRSFLKNNSGSGTEALNSDLMGLDQTQDGDRLAGIYVDATTDSLNVEEAIIQADSDLQWIGDGKPNVCLMHPERIKELKFLVGSREQVNKQTVSAMVGSNAHTSISYSGFTLMSDGGGSIECIGDRDCPYDEGFLLEQSSWEYKSLGKVPRVLNEDGLELKRLADADAYEMRIGQRGQLWCKRPGHNARIKFDV
jgi:VCBS repeat-containing protein